MGEIVGSHVADKREIEYLAGRGVQYKSACYFFRIDKEHIIDATRKGGIARFVNHSCLVVLSSMTFVLVSCLGRSILILILGSIFILQPNCVAKIITIRNEKKV